MCAPISPVSHGESSNFPNMPSSDQYSHAFMIPLGACSLECPEAPVETWSLASVVLTVMAFHWDQSDGRKPKKCHLENNFGFQNWGRRSKGGWGRTRPESMGRSGRSLPTDRLKAWEGQVTPAAGRTEGINWQCPKFYSATRVNTHKPH